MEPNQLNEVLKEQEHREISYSGVAIKVLSILGGIFASLTLLIFIFLAGAYDSEVALIILGIILMAGAIIGDREFKNIILDTFCISLYVAGFALLIFGLSKTILSSDDSIYLGCMILSLLTLFFTNNYILVFLATITFNASLLFFIQDGKMPEGIIFIILFMGSTLVKLNFSEAKIITKNEKYNRLFHPVQMGFFFSFACGLVFLLFHISMVSPYFTWMLSAFIWLGITYLISKILTLFGVEERKTKVLVYACCTLILLPTIYAPFISGGILLLLLSFYFNYKTEFVLSILVLTYIICQYYYDLQFTLLQKSGILFFTGILFLIFWFVFHKMMKKDETL